MTRATLLHVLARPAALNQADVRELEQLAQAFPYCQTAHLLLAKAAYDHGTMLAGQRLRRAATYAADRTLLRRLIEEVEPEMPQEQPVEQQEVGFEAPVLALAAAEVYAEPASVTPEPELLVAPEPVMVEASAPVEQIEEAPSPTVDEEIPAAEEPVSAPSLIQEDELAAPEITPGAIEIEETVEAPDASVLLDKEGIDIPTTEVLPEFIPETSLEEDALPPQAPAIRPPVEVGEARFEFGLAETPPPPAPTYELPGLVDEWAAAAVTLSLGSREPQAEADFLGGAALLSSPEAPVFTPAAFTGDATIGYGFGESSRLGFSMQLLELLEQSAEAAETASPFSAAAQPPAAALPPAGTFFEPDPLLLHHWAEHCPPAPTQPTSLDLINNFLRRQPRLSRPAMLPPSPTVQADLSVRSTRAEPDLVSESLARILVRQGKTARAIEIYEKLMVKHPEKTAHFATQIQLLQLPG